MLLSKAVICLLLNIIFPGVGSCIYGDYKMGLSFVSLIVLTTLLFFHIGWAFTPIGLTALGFCLLVVMLSTNLYGVWRVYKFQPNLRRGNIFLGFAYGLTLPFIFLGLWPYKHILFGVQLHFIPSTSMQPTLRPGDFILVDTRKKSLSSIKQGDIVTFTPNNKPLIYIKRISPKPQQYAHTLNTMLYLLGDNPSNSYDSRRFGLIKKDNVQGKARMVLFNLDKSNRTLKQL